MANKMVTVDLKTSPLNQGDGSTEGIVQELNKKEKKRLKNVFLKAELRLKEAKIYYDSMDSGEKDIFDRAKDFLSKKGWLPRSFRNMLKGIVERYKGEYNV